MKSVASHSGEYNDKQQRRQRSKSGGLDALVYYSVPRRSELKSLISDKSQAQRDERAYHSVGMTLISSGFVHPLLILNGRVVTPDSFRGIPKGHISALS